MRLSGHWMGDFSFVRLAEVISKKQDKRVVSITVSPTIFDCSGTIYFTDIQLQEGAALTGYSPDTKSVRGKAPDSKVTAWFNGVIRSKETAIVCNLGGIPTGLDISIYPKANMAAGSIELAQGVGGQKSKIPVSVRAGDEIQLLASSRQCLKNGVPEKKEGFYQYSAAWNSKHVIQLEEGKTARVLFELQEIEDKGERL